MKKIFITLTLIGLLLTLPNRAQAIIIVDTGPGPSGSSSSIGGSSLGYPLFSDHYQWLAGQFTLNESYTITDIEGWAGESLGVISLAVYGDDANSVDITNELFRNNFSVPHNLFYASWHGVNELSIPLAPGTYWAAFEVLNPGDYDGLMPNPVPSPLDRYAFNNFIVNDWVTTDSVLSLGFRIQGETPANAVPEPASVLLFSSGLLGMLHRRKQPSKS